MKDVSADLDRNLVVVSKRGRMLDGLGRTQSSLERVV